MLFGSKPTVTLQKEQSGREQTLPGPGGLCCAHTAPPLFQRISAGLVCSSPLSGRCTTLSTVKLIFYPRTRGRSALALKHTAGAQHSHHVTDRSSRQVPGRMVTHSSGPSRLFQTGLGVGGMRFNFDPVLAFFLREISYIWAHP